MAAYCQVYGVIHFTSPAGWLPVHRDQLRAQRSVTSMGKLYLLPYSFCNAADRARFGLQAASGLFCTALEGNSSILKLKVLELFPSSGFRFPSSTSTIARMSTTLFDRRRYDIRAKNTDCQLSQLSLERRAEKYPKAKNINMLRSNGNHIQLLSTVLRLSSFKWHCSDYIYLESWLRKVPLQRPRDNVTIMSTFL